MRSTFLICLTLFLFASCSTINLIGIETQKPGEVTFPESVKKILIVNNAVPQPSDAGYSYKLRGSFQKTTPIYADSALYEVCRTLGEGIMNSNYFEDVLLYNIPTRTDELYFKDQPLTPTMVTRLCRRNKVDAIISFDQLLFNIEKNIYGTVFGDFVGDIDIQIAGMVRAYLPGRDTPLASILVSDSIFFSETGHTVSWLNMYTLRTDEALKNAAKYIGSQLPPYFVPYWTHSSRWYYTGANTKWKSATASVKANKWEKAVQNWEKIHTQSKSWKAKAKTASNIALYYEVTGDLKQAYAWSEQSYNLFLKHAGEKDKQTISQKRYKETLLERLQSDIKLDVQLGGK